MLLKTINQINQIITQKFTQIKQIPAVTEQREQQWLGGDGAAKVAEIK